MLHFDMPNFHAPFPARINPQGQAAWQLTREWLHRTGLVRTDAELQRVERDGYWELAARAHPLVDRDELALCSDWIMWLFFFDDSLDDLQRPADYPHCRSIVRRLSALLDDPMHGEPTTPIEVAMIDVCRRTLPTMSSDWGERFVRHVREYVESMAREVRYRFDSTIPDLIEYADLRRRTGAVATLFDLAQYAAHREVPTPVNDHPLMVNLENAGNDCICLTNDILSYRKEVASGEVNNYVVATQSLLRCALPDAVNVVNDLQTARAESFCWTRTQVEEHFDEWELDHAARKTCRIYMDAMESWIRGSLDYSFRSPRYRDSRDFRLPSAA